MTKVEISDIVIDATDPEGLANFWSQLLGLGVRGTEGPYVVLERRRDEEVGLSFQRVAGVKSGKNRVHFDVSSDDIAATKALVESLGGRRVPGYEEGGFLVMADPEGNEFCVVTFAQIEVDDQGRTNYLDDLDLGD
ncbi:MAG: VOC family protein [Acidimicrobiales bacterium]